jgi:hypothetical protein
MCRCTPTAFNQNVVPASLWKEKAHS